MIRRFRLVAGSAAVHHMLHCFQLPSRMQHTVGTIALQWTTRSCTAIGNAVAAPSDYNLMAICLAAGRARMISWIV